MVYKQMLWIQFWNEMSITKTQDYTLFIVGK